MDINEVMQQVDDCYKEGKTKAAEQVMLQAIWQAEKEQDDAGLLQLLNELLGHYRETSQVEHSYEAAKQALKLAEMMGLVGTIPYATTLLNVANAYRAGGRLEDSMECYERVRETYAQILSPDNLLVASLENNISLLYQEMGDYKQAKESLLCALNIVKARGAEFEIAVTYTNLASTCMQLGQPKEAYEYALLAIEGFEAQGVEDTHYSAALSALGTYYFSNREYQSAYEAFVKARAIVAYNLGQNEFYNRLEDNIKKCTQAMDKQSIQEQRANTQMQNELLAADSIKGLDLCREYYEAFGKPMIEELFPEYASKIAVGLVGEGSDCFGFDDEISRDHDWGPDFCMWVTEETYEQIGEALKQAYAKLPREFKGYHRTLSPKGEGRRGVMTISSFYKRLLGADEWEQINWSMVLDASLAAAVNGEIFRDDEGIFSKLRNELMQGYPERILYGKLAEGAAYFSQTGQYNYERCLKRGDDLTAKLMLGDCLKEAMRLKHYLENKYPPHDKWLKESTKLLPDGEKIVSILELLILEQGTKQKVAELIEKLATLLVEELYHKNYISDIDNYLDAHTEELLLKAAQVELSKEKLLDKIIRLEFKAFDKVKNEGGRASCQDNWPTFYVMRKSQYLTWNKTMLLQYYYDFYREYHRGHNLIEEKYGRMMESTAPEEYLELQKYFPVLSEEKKAIIEEIVGLQVGWMEEFAREYPHLAGNARSVRTMEDNRYNTSYETYLRGEISTYSDKMLELYGRYVVEYARNGQNLAFVIMQNNVHLYGYESLEVAEDANDC